MATCFIVLGGPRTGTSCVAGVLSKLGVFMGDKLLPPHPMNEMGFYQDVEFEELFDSAHPEWMPPSGTILNFDHTKFHALIKRRCALGIDWGVKFRLAAYALGDFTVACSVPVKLIITSRDRAASVASLTHWFTEPNDPDPTLVIDRSAKAVQSAILAYGLTSLIVDYNALLTNPAMEVARIAVFVGRTTNITARQDAVQFVNPALRRY